MGSVIIASIPQALANYLHSMFQWEADNNRRGGQLQNVGVVSRVEGAAGQLQHVEIWELPKYI